MKISGNLVRDLVQTRTCLSPPWVNESLYCASGNSFNETQIFICHFNRSVYFYKTSQSEVVTICSQENQVTNWSAELKHYEWTIRRSKAVNRVTR